MPDPYGGRGRTRTWTRSACRTWCGGGRARPDRRSSPRLLESAAIGRNRAGDRGARPAADRGSELARRLARITGTEVREVRPAGAQHQWAHYQVTLADGRLAFAKAAREDLGGVFEAEARGLRWLAEAHAVPVPEVLGWDTATLAVAWLPQQAPDQHAAEQFGRDLAVPARVRARRGSAPPGRGSSPPCRWATAPGTRSPWPPRRPCLAR